MGSKAPRKKYKPRPVNPEAFRVALLGVRKFSNDEKLAELLNLRAAIDNVARKTASMSDWTAIKTASNMVEQLARTRFFKDDGFIEEVEKVIVALVASGRACRSHELATLRDLSSVYATALDELSYSMYYETKLAVERRVTAGLGTKLNRLTLDEKPEKVQAASGAETKSTPTI